jgi:hypothetical protein
VSNHTELRRLSARRHLSCNYHFTSSSGAAAVPWVGAAGSLAGVVARWHALVRALVLALVLLLLLVRALLLLPAAPNAPSAKGSRGPD